MRISARNSSTTPTSPTVVFARWISPRTQELLRALGIGFLDTTGTGNLWQCTQTGQQVKCTATEAIAANADASSKSMAVNVSPFTSAFPGCRSEWMTLYRDVPMP